ncbi:hypothetical protein IEQ34_017791 [Dendrobium chrysotoxum]|uniref:Uncharacterized protein n=1 Tax=Dendrobium chrysotoxum TaxID=161865 RepID=A0AAV7GD29_DENCH|nr:hypothetical protein IEQ34_017791 [Dendrobium chrysotoxum]
MILIKNLAILLLDEATHALDSELEKLVVAHKLSTVRSADRIAVIDNGAIVEIGTHEDLIAVKSAHYSRLVRLQRNASILDPDHSPVPQ